MLLLPLVARTGTKINDQHQFRRIVSTRTEILIEHPELLLLLDIVRNDVILSHPTLFITL